MEATECGAASLGIILQHHGNAFRGAVASCVVSRATEVMPPTWSWQPQPWPHRQRLQKGPEALAAVRSCDLVLGVQPLLVFEGLRGDRVALNDPPLDRARCRSTTSIAVTPASC